MAVEHARTQAPLALSLAESGGPARLHFAVDGHCFVAIPQKEWTVVQRKCGAREKVRAAGFLKLDGIRHVLIERPESECAAAHPSPISSLLTSRELQIAYSIADGKCDKVIAHDLGISEYTVREHMRRIFYKLKVSKRAAVVAQLVKGRVGMFPALD